MTEAEWLTCAEPAAMLERLKGKVSDRKLRLFGVACCRRIWHLIVHPVSREALEVAQRCADGLASDDERHLAYGAADDIRCLLGDVGTGLLEPEAEEEYGGLLGAAGVTADAASAAADEAWGCAEPEPEDSVIGAAAAEAVEHFAATDAGPNVLAGAAERAAQADLLRDIMGNPFRTAPVDPAWLKPSVVDLARTIYDEWAFERMPELAELLQAAGCYNPDILTHCRSAGPHARGCWVLDLLLGKE
jgi:hypothetical protein